MLKIEIVWYLHGRKTETKDLPFLLIHDCRFQLLFLLLSGFFFGIWISKLRKPIKNPYQQIGDFKYRILEMERCKFSFFI